MATLLSVATGNFTSSGSWALCDSTSEFESGTTQTTVSTGSTDSSAFTPGAITVDGVAIRLRSRATSPTGTFTVTLRNSTDSVDVDSVTVNVSDMPESTDTADGFDNGWIFFKFGSSHLLLAGKNYIVRLSTSSSSQIVVMSSSGNLHRQLRTTTTQAPAAGDKLIGCGEWTGAGSITTITHTMDNTASTTFGSASFTTGAYTLNQGYTLTWGTSASTNYLLKIAGVMYITTGGAMTMGTAGTPMPSTSTAILDFVISSNLDGGLYCAGTFESRGVTKTTITTVTSTANSGQPVVNVADVTGWAATDEVLLTPTERVSSQFEVKAISSIATLAVTMTANLTNKHSGSGSASVPDAVRGHAGMLNHNVKIRGTSASLRAYIYFLKNCSATVRYTEMKWMGNQSTSRKWGVTWSLNSSPNIQYCSIYTYGFIGPSGTDFAIFYFNNNVCYDADSSAFRLTETSLSLAFEVIGNLIVDSGGNFGMLIPVVRGIITDNISSGGHQSGFSFNAGGSSINYTKLGTGTFARNEAYCNGTAGFEIQNAGISFGTVIDSCIAWRNQSHGWYLNWTILGVTWQSCHAFGNSVGGIVINSSSINACLFVDCVFNGETSFGQPRGVFGYVSCWYIPLRFENCDFGQTIAHSSVDIGYNTNVLWDLLLINCRFSTSPAFTALGTSSNFALTGHGSVIKFMKYNQTAGDHRRHTKYGGEQSDSVIYHTNAPSVRMTPLDANWKFESSGKRKQVDSGGTVTVSVWVRKSSSGDAGGANYNGNHPRLVMRKNPAIGLDADVVLDTMTAGVGTWEELTGTTSASSGDDGVLEFYVDCDGTAGWVNIDDWSLT